MRAAACLIAFASFATSGAALASMVMIEPIELPELVGTTPIIVVARLAASAPERRTITIEGRNRAGKPTNFGFGADVWLFEPVEVLKNTGDWPLPNPIPVVSASLRQDFEIKRAYVLEGIRKSPIRRFYRPKKALRPDEPGRKTTILFLQPSPLAMSAENRDQDVISRTFGDAFRFSIDDGLEGMASLSNVKRLIRSPGQ